MLVLDGECPIQCLLETCRVLKKTDVLELTTPNIFHWRVILRQTRGLPAPLSDTRHISRWSETELRNALPNAEFSSFRFNCETLQQTFSPHRPLEKIAELTFPSGTSKKNMMTKAIRRETRNQ